MTSMENIDHINMRAVSVDGLLIYAEDYNRKKDIGCFVSIVERI